MSTGIFVYPVKTRQSLHVFCCINVFVQSVLQNPYSGYACQLSLEDVAGHNISVCFIDEIVL